MAGRLRVLFYIGGLDAGGAERQVLTQLAQFNRSEFEPHLMLARLGGSLQPEVPADVPIHCCSTRQHRGKLARWRRIKRFAQLLNELQIDLVYDRTYLATLDAAGACWLRPTPRISAAVADPAVQLAMYERFPKYLWRRYSRWAYHAADLVLANSAGLREQLIKFWQLPPERVELQPNAIDFERIGRLSEEPLAAPLCDGFRILTVGRIDEDKGHADMLAAVAELVQRRGMSDLVWQIAGTGPAESSLKSSIEQQGLAAHVQLLGTIANPFPHYSAADLFVLPSRTEGLPNVLIEALACGTPVISTDCESGPREILENGRWGTLVPVRDPAALAGAVVAARGRMDWERQRAVAARDSLRSRFDAAVVVPRLEEHFNRVARR